MKAIILAGGNGTRLHPLSLALPKPMTRLADKPLLEHIVKLLKQNGVNEICMTLRYLPKTITDYFGSGSMGVYLEYRIEEKALGTAGGIKACGDFLNSEDFIVISGDAACDFDLRRLVDFHKAQNAEVTLALHKSDKPLEYGLVMTNDSGRVTGFIEKPSRDRVYTDLVNTGIYVVSSSVLPDIPDGTAFDFARDLFPKLLNENRKICALPMEGYWCDIGSCASYLQANFDALSGRLKIDYEIPERYKGVWAAEPLNPKATYRAPCYIGRHAAVHDGAVIGPYAVIGSGSVVSAGAGVRGSVVDGAYLEAYSRVSGSVICRGVRIGADARLLDGSVVGENAVISQGCLVSEGVRIWPDKHIPAGTKLRSNIVSGMARSAPLFEERGKIRANLDCITPGLCLALGSAAQYGRVGTAHGGGEAARILSECFACGAQSAGCDTLYFDAPIPATAAYAAKCYKTGITFFAEQHGNELTLWFFSENGLPISRETERRLENVNSVSGVTIEQTGFKRLVNGTEELHIAAARQAYSAGLHTISVNGNSASARLLKSALSLAGVEFVPFKPGTACFDISPDGFSLSLTDENSVTWEHGKLLTALALCEFKHGGGVLTLPYEAPRAAELLAKGLGGQLLRLGRDGAAAEAELLKKPYSSDAIFLALRILGMLEHFNSSFVTLMSALPGYFTASRNVPLEAGRGQAMRQLGAYFTDSEMVSGLRFRSGGGYAHVTPGAEGVLYIRTEAASAEAAEEICIDIEKRLKSKRE